MSSTSNSRRGYENKTNVNGNVRPEDGRDRGDSKTYKKLIPQFPAFIPTNDFAAARRVFAKFEDKKRNKPEEPKFHLCAVVGIIPFIAQKTTVSPGQPDKTESTVHSDFLIWLDVPINGIDCGLRQLAAIDPFYFDTEKRGSADHLGLAFRGLFFENGEPVNVSHD